MTLKYPFQEQRIPQETVEMAWKMSRKGTVPMHLRDALGAIYSDEDFADLFAHWGRPAHLP